MPTLPQLIDEDVQQIDGALRKLLMDAGATTTLVIDKGGFLISHQGDVRKFDLTTIAALASGAFMANQTIANEVHETQFNSVYQQGANFSFFTTSIDENCLLVVIFEARRSVGAVKYYAKAATTVIATQLEVAQARNPGGGLDLSFLNVADSESLFHKKPTSTDAPTP